MTTFKLTYCIDSKSFKFDMDHCVIIYSETLGVVGIEYNTYVPSSKYEEDFVDQNFISEIRNKISLMENLKCFSCAMTTEKDFTEDVTTDISKIPLNVVSRPVNAKIRAEIHMMLVDFGLTQT